MSTAKEYRRYAAQCIDMANDASNVKAQGLLFDMAKVWLQLAEEAKHLERSEAVRPRWQGNGVENPLADRIRPPQSALQQPNNQPSGRGGQSAR